MAIFNSVKNNKKFLFGGRRSIEDVDEEYYDEYRRVNNISPDQMVKNPIVNGGGVGSPGRYSGEFDRLKMVQFISNWPKTSMDLRMNGMTSRRRRKSSGSSN